MLRGEEFKWGSGKGTKSGGEQLAFRSERHVGVTSEKERCVQGKAGQCGQCWGVFYRLQGCTTGCHQERVALQGEIRGMHQGKQGYIVEGYSLPLRGSAGKAERRLLWHRSQGAGAVLRWAAGGWAPGTRAAEPRPAGKSRAAGASQGQGMGCGACALWSQRNAQA